MVSTNDYENISEILVPHIDVDVEMNKADISHTTIGSDSLGPCFFFLLDFLMNDQPYCYMYHYSFPFDESKLSAEKVLIKYLNIIWDSLIETIECKITSGETLKNTKISNFKLVVGGGDLTDGQLIRQAFSLLNKDEMNVISRSFDDEHVLCFYKQLIRNTIILKPVTRNMSNKKEAQARRIGHGIDFPSLWIHYCCINWRSDTRQFDIAILQLEFSKNTQSQWQLQTKAIEQFKLECQHDEKLIFQQALLLIPTNSIFTSEICPIQDHHTFTSTNVDKRFDFDEAEEENQEENEHSSKSFSNVQINEEKCTNDDIENNDKKRKKSRNKSKRHLKLLADEESINNKIEDVDTIESSIKFQIKNIDEDIKTMPDKEKKYKQIDQYEDELNFDDKQHVPYIDENNKINSRIKDDVLFDVAKLLKNDAFSIDMPSTSDENDFDHSDDPFKEPIKSITTQLIPLEQVKHEKDNKNANKKEIRAIKAQVMSLPSTSLNQSETITEDNVYSLLSQKQYITLTELIQNFLPKSEQLQTNEMKYNIAQKIEIILKRLNVKEKIMNGETWINL